MVTFCSLSEMPIARQPWPYLCSLCLPRSLGSAAAYTDHFPRNAHCISLFLSEGSASDNLLVTPSLPGLRLTVSSRLQAQGFIPGTILALLSPTSWFAPLAHLQMLHCADLSDVFVCREGNSLLNYSCLI